MKSYTVGLLFRHGPTRGVEVLLIRKLKPEWQRGLLNGVGGGIEPGETPAEGMVREFREETGCASGVGGWRHFATVGADYAAGRPEEPWTVYFFERQDGWSFAPESVEAESVEAERVEWVRVDDVLRGAARTIPNLRWLVPLALDRDAVVAEVRDPS